MVGTNEHWRRHFTLPCPQNWDPASDLQSLIVAIRVDNGIRERGWERRREVGFSEPQASISAHDSPPLPMNIEEPMQLGRAKLSQAERDRRMRMRCCLYCRKPSHFRSNYSELMVLCEVFSKNRAASLPLHRPYDCVIDLLPGTCPPQGRLHSLCSWKACYGGIYQWSPEQWVHPTINFTGRGSLLLCGQKRWCPSALYGLAMA